MLANPAPPGVQPRPDVEPPHRPLGRGSWLVASLTFLAGFAFFYAFISPTPSPIDAGFNANAALRVSRGDVPYRDFFTLVTPLSFFLNAAIVGLFGPSLHALCVGAAVVLAAAYAIFYLIAREFLARAWALATWAVAVPFSAALYGVEPSYTAAAAAFAFAAILHVLRALRGGPRWHMAAAGAAIALAFWSKQTVGAYVGLSLAIFFLLGARRRETWRDAASAAAGFVVPSMVFIAYLLWNGAFGAFVQDCFVAPFRYFAGEAHRLPPALFDLAWDGNGFEPLVYYVAIGAVLIGVGELLGQRKSRGVDPALFYLTIASGCLLLISLERYSLQNLLCVVPPTFVLLARPIARGAAGGSSRLVAAILAAAVLCYCGLSVRYARYRWSSLDVEGYASRVAFARQFFAANAGRRIVLLPSLPLYYFVAGATNPTRFDVALPGNLAPADRAELANDLATRIDLVFFDDGGFDRRLFRDYNPALTAVILQHFEPIGRGPHGEIILARRAGVPSP